MLRTLILLALAAGITQVPATAAADYPSKPIRFISPFLPGGSQDVIARIVGGKLGERLGQQVVVDNRSGAAGIIAAELTARAQPDGYTILMVTAGPITIAPNLNRKLPYDPMKELTPVTQLVETPMALIASLSLPAKSLGDAIALAKARSGQLNYASVGSGSISHLTMELFKTHTGSEASLRNFEVPVWAGVATTAGTPKPVIDRLYREMHAVLQSPDIRERLAHLGSDIVGSTPEQFAALLREDLARWAKVIKTANVKID